jgi:hypothetical protein
MYVATPLILGVDGESQILSSMKQCSSLSDTWSTVIPMPAACIDRAAVAVGQAMNVLGGNSLKISASVLKYDSYHTGHIKRGRANA